MKTSNRIVFHGPNGDKACRREVKKFAKKYGGKFSYNSFWVWRQQKWHSEAMKGKAAFCAEVPIEKTKAAIAAARKLEVDGLKFSHHY